jgi:hypothetical protein
MGRGSGYACGNDRAFGKNAGARKLTKPGSIRKPQGLHLNATTVAMMLLAAILHASWHSLVKAGDARIATLAGMGIISCCVAVVATLFVPVPSAPVWGVIAVLTALHVGYKLCLARAYALGELSRAFPMARGMVPLFAALLGLVVFAQARRQAPRQGQDRRFRRAVEDGARRRRHEHPHRHQQALEAMASSTPSGRSSRRD